MSTKDQKKARQELIDRAKKVNINSKKVLKCGDLFYGMLKNSTHDQAMFLMGIGAAFFNNARAIVFKTLPREGIIVPDSKIIDPKG